jgi:hypothetical protein
VTSSTSRSSAATTAPASSWSRCWSSTTTATGDLAKAKVTASVVDHHRGKKIRVFTYKNKTRQSRTMGHRQSLTRLKVETIDLGGRKRAARSGAKAKKEQQDKQEEEG